MVAAVRPFRYGEDLSGREFGCLSVIEKTARPMETTERAKFVPFWLCKCLKCGATDKYSELQVRKPREYCGVDQCTLVSEKLALRNARDAERSAIAEAWRLKFERRRARKRARNKKRLAGMIKSQYGCMNPECGWQGEFEQAMLDFHHKDPSQKVGAVAAMVMARVPLKAVIEEIEKCVVLCSNCHRGVHSKAFNIDGVETCKVSFPNLTRKNSKL